MSASRQTYVAVAAKVNARLTEARTRADSVETTERLYFLSGTAAGTRHLAEDLAEVFAAENPRFDRDRFLQACGL